MPPKYFYKLHYIEDISVNYERKEKCQFSSMRNLKKSRYFYTCLTFIKYSLNLFQFIFNEGLNVKKKSLYNDS